MCLANVHNPLLYSPKDFTESRVRSTESRVKSTESRVRSTRLLLSMNCCLASTHSLSLCANDSSAQTVTCKRQEGKTPPQDTQHNQWFSATKQKETSSKKKSHAVRQLTLYVFFSLYILCVTSVVIGQQRSLHSLFSCFDQHKAFCKVV